MRVGAAFGLLNSNHFVWYEANCARGSRTYGRRELAAKMTGDHLDLRCIHAAQLVSRSHVRETLAPRRAPDRL
jgi:hypothetical protein